MTSKTARGAAAASGKGVHQGQAAPIDMSTLAEANQANLEAVMASGAAFFDAMTTMNQELAGFAARRLRMTIERSEALMRCDQPETLLRAQMDFSRLAYEQYLIEAAKLMTMAAEITEDCWRPLQTRSLSALHELHRR